MNYKITHLKPFGVLIEPKSETLECERSKC